MRARRWAGAGLWVLAGAHLAEALVLRRRARALLPLVPVAAAPPDPAAAGRGAAAHGVLTDPPLIVAADARGLDPATIAAVDRLVAGGLLDAVDLVPGDLPADRALRLLRRVDPDPTGADPLASPAGCHEAVALHPALAARMGVAPGPGAAPVATAAMVRLWRDAQRHAPVRRGTRVAPRLPSSPMAAGDRWAELDELTAFARPFGPLAEVLLGAETAHLAAMTAGLVLAPVPAVAALATWTAQPALVFGGRSPSRPALQPPWLLAAAALRLARAWRDNLATAAAGWRARTSASPSSGPPSGMPAPVASPDALFEDARTTCPWCGGATLAPRLDTTDLIQHKPGRFHLDECTACGHVFQNPALSLAGLDHYYAEFYEGDGAETWEFVFAGMGPTYRRRLDALARFARPQAWLDVGTGHGHFCLAARARWPGAVIDGLDLSGAVEVAARRRWIDRGYRGLFPDLADGLPRSYDVVSMHHYLEHTREPRRELAAAAKVLEPGGYLMVEGPDVESPWGRRLGRWWRCWFQPQHQHFVTCANLLAALDEVGFDIVAVERGPAGEGMDLASAVAFWVNGTAPGPASRWAPPPTRGRRLRRVATLVGAVPLLALASLGDLVKDSRLRRPGTASPGNAYRVIARRR